MIWRRGKAHQFCFVFLLKIITRNYTKLAKGQKVGMGRANENAVLFLQTKTKMNDKPGVHLILQKNPTNRSKDVEPCVHLGMSPVTTVQHITSKLII